VFHTFSGLRRASASTYTATLSASGEEVKQVQLQNRLTRSITTLFAQPKNKRLQNEQLNLKNSIFIAVPFIFFPRLYMCFFIFSLFAACFLSLSVFPVSFVCVVSLFARRLVAS